jgi:hypothetical protein
MRSLTLGCLTICLLLEMTSPRRTCGMLHEDCNRSARQCASTCHLLNNGDAESGLCFSTNLPCECTVPMSSSGRQEVAMLKPRGTHGVDWVCTTQGTGHDDFPYIDLRASLRPRRRDGAVSVTDSARTCPNPTVRRRIVLMAAGPTARRSRPGLRRPPEPVYITRIVPSHTS